VRQIGDCPTGPKANSTSQSDLIPMGAGRRPLTEDAPDLPSARIQRPPVQAPLGRRLPAGAAEIKLPGHCSRFAMQHFAPDFAPIGCIWNGCTLHCVYRPGWTSAGWGRMNTDQISRRLVGDVMFCIIFFIIPLRCIAFVLHSTD